MIASRSIHIYQIPYKDFAAKSALRTPASNLAWSYVCIRRRSVKLIYTCTASSYLLRGCAPVFGVKWSKIKREIKRNLERGARPRGPGRQLKQINRDRAQHALAVPAWHGFTRAHSGKTPQQMEAKTGNIKLGESPKLTNSVPQKSEAPDISIIIICNKIKS